MQKALTGKKIALLVANGFEQDDVVAVQRALLAAGTMPITVSPEQGVLTSWHGTAWGHCFTIDAKIGETLSVDYDMLVIPGGSRHVPRLLASLHTERIVSGFALAQKPIVSFNEGAQVLDACKCPESSNVLKKGQEEERQAFISRMMELFTGQSVPLKKAA